MPTVEGSGRVDPATRLRLLAGLRINNESKVPPPGVLTIEAAARRFGVGKRTIQRDLEKLRAS